MAPRALVGTSAARLGARGVTGPVRTRAPALVLPLGMRARGFVFLRV